MPDRNAHPSECSVCGALGQFCGRPSLPDAPFPICLKHASKVLRYLNSFLTEEDGAALTASRDLEVEVPPERPVVPERGVSLVYYLRIGRYIKIGQTANLSERLRFYPPDAELLAYELGDRELEQQRIREFLGERRGRLEWFEPTDRLLGHVREVHSQMAA